MMKAIRAIVLLTLFMTLGTSCVKEKLIQTYNKQEESIDKYVTNSLKGDVRVTYNNGAARLTLKEGEGEELKADGSVAFYYAGFTFKGSLSAAAMFGTNHEPTAQAYKWDVTDPDYSILEVNLKDDRLLEGVRDGLVGVKAGEECEILFCGKYGFGNSTFGIIPANSALAFKIWVVSVSNE